MLNRYSVERGEEREEGGERRGKGGEDRGRRGRKRRRRGEREEERRERREEEREGESVIDRWRGWEVRRRREIGCERGEVGEE